MKENYMNENEGKIIFQKTFVKIDSKTGFVNQNNLKITMLNNKFNVQNEIFKNNQLKNIEELSAVKYSIEANAIAFANEKINKIKKNGYTEITFGNVLNIIEQMMKLNLDKIGCDVFIRSSNLDKRLSIYLKEINDKSEIVDILDSYKSSSVAKQLMSDELNINIVDFDATQKEIDELKKLISSSKLDQIGVFIGHSKDGLIYEGIPSRQSPSKYPHP